MLRLLLFFLLLSCSFSALAQFPDMLSVRRKNGRTIKTFYVGSYISFFTKSGTPVSGSIVNMCNDSVYIYAFNIRAVPSIWGATMVDTFARRIERIHYGDIGRVEVYSRKRGFYGRLAGYAAIGGGGYIFLNMFNGLINGEQVTAKENLNTLIAPAAVAVGGIAARKLLKDVHFTKRRHRIVYISLN